MTLIDYIIGPFQYGFMVRALIASMLVGIMCPVIGAYVITRGRAFMGDALAHSVLPGMALGFLLWTTFPAFAVVTSKTLAFFAAVPSGIAIALLMGYLTRRTGISDDTSIGIVFAGMFALGLVMLSTDAVVNVSIEDLLLGQVLGVTQTEVFVSLGLTALVVVGIYTFHRQLVYTTFDPVGATGNRNQDGSGRIRAAHPPCPGHRHRHPGRRNCPGDGDAHHAPRRLLICSPGGLWESCSSGRSSG